MQNTDNDTGAQASPMTKAEYVEKLTRWLMPDSRDPDLARDARQGSALTGVYRGKSRRITRLVSLAYLRGVRRGAACAWEAKQPVTFRDGEASS